MLSRADVKAGIFMTMALELAELSTCSRKHVGALIVRDGRCISWGYNGAPPGLAHCNHLPDNEEPCARATHAEANAVAFAARQGISTEGGHLFVTVSPCIPCAQLLIAAGIVEVAYAERYRDESGLFMLREAGVAVH